MRAGLLQRHDSFLCPELPDKQKEALHYGVKEPFIYTHVAIRNWTAFEKLGVRQIISPGSYHVFTMLDFPVSLGDYKFPSTPQEPMVLFMLRTPCKQGLPRRDQYRMGRFEFDEHTIFHLRAQHSRSVESHAVWRWIRCGPGHRSHHGEPLGPRLCLRYDSYSDPHGRKERPW